MNLNYFNDFCNLYDYIINSSFIFVLVFVIVEILKLLPLLLTIAIITLPVIYLMPGLDKILKRASLVTGILTGGALVAQGSRNNDNNEWRKKQEELQAKQEAEIAKNKAELAEMKAMGKAELEAAKARIANLEQKIASSSTNK